MLQTFCVAANVFTLIFFERCIIDVVLVLVLTACQRHTVFRFSSIETQSAQSLIALAFVERFGRTAFKLEHDDIIKLCLLNGLLCLSQTHFDVSSSLLNADFLSAYPFFYPFAITFIRSD